MTQNAYDAFSHDYDRFVNWDERLAVEMPFLLEKLKAFPQKADRPIRVLDAACGTGMHALALAKAGFQAAGADISPGMIKQAQKNARKAGQKVEFKAAGFGSLAEIFNASSLFPYDAVLCLGNSLPHVLSPEAFQEALADMSDCLRPGGILLLQNRNFDAVMKEKNRWLGTQSHREGNEEWLFLRFYDFSPDSLITFNIIRLYRKGSSSWTQEISTTRLFPITQALLLELLGKAGFGNIACYGKMGNEPFDAEKSGNLVLLAEKR